MMVDGSTVRAWSAVRLPFEPRGDLLDYRAALRLALRRLPRSAATNQGLIATYAAPTREYVDVETLPSTTWEQAATATSLRTASSVAGLTVLTAVIT